MFGARHDDIDALAAYLHLELCELTQERTNGHTKQERPYHEAEYQRQGPQMAHRLNQFRVHRSSSPVGSWGLHCERMTPNIVAHMFFYTRGRYAVVDMV